MRLSSCFKLSGRILTQDSLVKCVQEEADDRIMFHVNNIVKVDKFSEVHIQIFFQYRYFSMCAVHFKHWMYFGLDTLLIISGKSENKEVTPLEKNINGMEWIATWLIYCLIHTLAGCYKTSKVGKKQLPFRLL